MIEIGFITSLPEPLGFADIRKEVDDWRRSEGPPGDVPTIRIVVHVPGSHYRPNFKGVVVEPSPESRAMGVDVALEERDLESPSELAAALAQSVQAAVAAAVKISAKGDQIRTVEAEIDADEALPRVGDVASVGSSQPGKVEVYLPLEHRESHEALFALEDDLASAVEAAHAGYLDGNDVATDYHTLYFAGPSSEALAEALREALSNHATRIAAKVSISAAD